MAEINVEALPKAFSLEQNVMKTCFPSNGKGLSTPLASSLERCSYFVIVDSNQETGVTTLLNDAQTAARGAGIQVAQLIIDQQIKAVIVLEIDSIAFDILLKAGIKIYLGIDGTVQENLDLFCQGRLVKIRIAE